MALEEQTTHTMQTVTIDIINDKVLNLLKDLELLQLIRVHKEALGDKGKIDWSKFKGAMSKQPTDVVDQQLNELRSEWE